MEKPRRSEGAATHFHKWRETMENADWNKFSKAAHGLVVGAILNAGVRNPEDVDDAMQETWRKLLIHNASVPVHPSAFESYLHRTAANSATDLLRKRKRSRELPMEETSLPIIADAEMDNAEEHAVRSARNAELRRIISAAMGKLTPEHRLLLELKYVKEMTAREIAQFYGCNVNQVKTRVYRAREALKRKLRPEELDV